MLCSSCSHMFDFFGSYEEAEAGQECPECKEVAYRQTSGSSIQFKGWFPGNQIKKTGKT